MTEAIKYLVVCSCTGKIEPVAYLDDDRPIGGALRVDAPVGQMIVIAPELGGGEEPRDQPDEYTAMFTKTNVTRTHWNRWGDPHVTWVIRCGDCSTQAQMSQVTYGLVADQLAAQLGMVANLPVPTVSDPSATEQRHVIPLGVLCRMVTRENR